MQPTLVQKLFISTSMLESLEILEETGESIEAWVKAKQFHNGFIKFTGSSQNIEGISSRNNIVEDNFTEEIMEQLLDFDITDRLQKIVKLITYDLSEVGFLTQSVEEMANCFGATISEIQEALTIIKRCEPKGLACINLQEYLILQSKEMPPFVGDILANYYYLFLHQKWERLSRESGHSLDVIKDAAAHISKMKTRPVSKEYREPVHLKPDMTVTIENGKPETVLHPHAFPETTYDFDFANSTTEDAEVKRFVESQMLEARKVSEILQLRKETTHRILDTIVERQSNFFIHGPEQLKSLTMTEVAYGLQISVSTVSRAVKNKSIATPSGTYEMRYFFVTTNNSLDESKMTKGQLKQFIFNTIQYEDVRKPVSDQEIVKKLEEKGVYVSRRVIAKYRQQMNLSSSYKRRFK